MLIPWHSVRGSVSCGAVNCGSMPSSHRFDSQALSHLHRFASQSTGLLSPSKRVCLPDTLRHMRRVRREATQQLHPYAAPTFSRIRHACASRTFATRPASHSAWPQLLPRLQATRLPVSSQRRPLCLCGGMLRLARAAFSASTALRFLASSRRASGRAQRVAPHPLGLVWRAVPRHGQPSRPHAQGPCQDVRLLPVLHQ
eukprot:6193303-Pleurochrysis_carterae.AAC.1